MIGGSALSVVAMNKLNAAVYQSITKLNQKFIKDNSPDGLYWDAVAKHFMFQDGVIMMNNGTVGPMPEPVFNTLMKYFKVQATNPYDCYNFFPTLKDEVRNKVADFIKASPDEIVINRNTTEGINTAIHGLDMNEGDEILISSLEHPAGIHPCRLKKKRFGITVTEVPLGVPPKSSEEIVNAFEKAITPKTKAICISHTVYITGLISPIKELSEMAHKHGILIIVDSAHGIGMLDLNMKEMGADVFCASPYKWMGAPTGCGIMYVKKDVQEKIYPLIATGGWDTYENAQRFETLSQRADPIIFALGEAVDFQNAIGKKRIERRIKTLAGYLKQELQKIPKVRLHTSTDPYLSGGLTAFSIEGIKAETIVYYLREKYNIVIRTIGRDRDNTRGVRVSTNIYVSTNHVDILLEGVHHLARRKA
jgi:selenocysteine lyase/cysteine desulfurase